MNALKRHKAQGRIYREAQTFMLETLQLMCEAYAVVLHDRGFGAKRLEDISAEAINLVHSQIERYDGDCAETALKVKCRDFGFRCGITLDERGAVCWKRADGTVLAEKTREDDNDGAVH